MEQVTPGPGKKGTAPANPKPPIPRGSLPCPRLPMIRSRAAASRAPAAPLRGRFAPPDPAARSQEPAAIRAREHSEARSRNRKYGHRGTTCGHRGDAGKRTASGPKERSAEPLALPIRARFIPLPGHPACSSDWRMPRIPGGRFLRRSPRARRQAGLVRTRGRGGQPDQPAPSHRGCSEAMTECAPPAAGWKTGTVSWRATLRAGLDSARAASSCRKGSRCLLSGTGSGRAGHIPVVD